MEVRNQISYVLSDFPFHYELQTRWKDMDAFGHVNNAIFLSYIEDARITLFKRWKLNNDKRSIIIASQKIDYLRQIVHPSHLIVGERISRIGNKSFDIESVIFFRKDEIPVAISVAVCVCFDYENNKSLLVFTEIIADYKKN